MLSFGFGTHTGVIRQHNEDAYLTDDLLGLWVVADGMGGENGGEIASAITIKSIDSAVKVGRSLPDAIDEAHKQVKKAVTVGMGHKGMGTTVVSLKINNGNYEICWVGDSRAYLYDGSLKQLTRDHTIVQLMVDDGEITEEEAKTHPSKNQIYQCVGAEPIEDLEICMIHGHVSDGQKFLLCSDGLNDEITDDVIRHIIKHGATAQTTVDDLIQAALINGGRDNITAIVVTIEEPEQRSSLLSEVPEIESATETSLSLGKGSEQNISTVKANLTEAELIMEEVEVEDEDDEVTLLQAIESGVAESDEDYSGVSENLDKQLEGIQNEKSNMPFYFMVLGLITILIMVVVFALMSV